MVKRMLWVTFGFFICLACFGVYMRQFNPDALFYFFIGEVSWEVFRSRSAQAAKKCCSISDQKGCESIAISTETVGQ